MAVKIIEASMFLLIFTILLKVTNNNILQYKLLFLFIIITTTIESGIKYGMSIAIFSSLIIFIFDLQYDSSVSINKYLENDIILVSIFISTALVLGYYTKIESQKNEVKDKQLRSLSKELKENNNRREYIEKLLINNDACYKNLIEDSENATFIHRNSKLIFANKSAIELLGYDLEELFKKDIVELFPQAEYNMINRELRLLVDREVDEVIIRDRDLIRKDGEVVSVDGNSICFLYEGKPTVLTTYRDITYKKRAERLQKEMEENEKLLKESMDLNNTMTEFFSNISHEFKTPLNIISSTAQLLSMYDSKSNDYIMKTKRYLGSIRQNCLRLTRLVNNILSITKVDKGVIKLNLSNHNIVNIAEEIVTSVASYVESKGLEIIFDTDVEEKFVLCDIEKMESVFLNLLSNAIKFSKEASTILVTVVDKCDKVAISVKDTGDGIPEDKLELIFERFGQVNKTFRRNAEGTGIGLTLVKSYVEMHGGTIEVKSVVDEGTEFIVELETVECEFMITKASLYEVNLDSVKMEFSDIL